MPRRPRLEIPGIPLHVTQRGVNRCAIFLDDDDRHHYLRLLRDSCREHGIAIHAFVLMDNHVHLLVTSRLPGALSVAMRAVGQNYVQYFNHRHGRIGTLWQGRFKSCLVDSELYVMHVIRYIELNPVRAVLVADPVEYRWSSARTHMGLTQDSLVQPHPVYLSLGDDWGSRAEAYREWLYLPIADEELAVIREYIAQERALGDVRFQRMVEETLQRPASCRRPGRPRAAVTSPA